MAETYIVYDKKGKILRTEEGEESEGVIKGIGFIPEGGSVRRVIGEALSVGYITEEI